MHSIKLKIDDKIYEDLLCQLREFSKEKLEIIVEESTLQDNNTMSSTQKSIINNSQQYLHSLQLLRDKFHFYENKIYLEYELKKIIDGNVAFYSIYEVEQRLNLIIKKYEDSL